MLLRRFPPNFLQTVLRRFPPNFLQTVLRRFPPNFLLLLVGRLASLFIVIYFQEKSHHPIDLRSTSIFPPRLWYSLVLRVHNSIFVAPPFFWKAILESSCVPILPPSGSFARHHSHAKCMFYKRFMLTCQITCTVSTQCSSHGTTYL